ncbi:MAG: Type site-specific deoxyribonuclease [Phenylobacterium sp.]|uniref:DpnI domain-containing protein n=1 Tax=Phenylobacterium sp. TaxID=1871053 RepID=UPI002610B131|nr:DpnI domain-containing protein [Phenylobacterium sp.]MDB5498215.1 Type site-specific deoxyribonuclease [Phenylobacterium sp.]
MQGEDDDFGRPLGFEEAPAHFESALQKARVTTERWALNWLFCPNCGERGLGQFANNSKVADFYCAVCREEYELKSTKGRFGRKVVDGAYGAMRERLAQRNNPNFLLLTYDAAALSATDLMVIPKHFFTPDIIEQRKPLADTARRAGWIGCNNLSSTFASGCSPFGMIQATVAQYGVPARKGSDPFVWSLDPKSSLECFAPRKSPNFNSSRSKSGKQFAPSGRGMGTTRTIVRTDRRNADGPIMSLRRAVGLIEDVMG